MDTWHSVWFLKCCIKILFISMMVFSGTPLKLHFQGECLACLTLVPAPWHSEERWSHDGSLFIQLTSKVIRCRGQEATVSPKCSHCCFVQWQRVGASLPADFTCSGQRGAVSGIRLPQEHPAASSAITLMLPCDTVCSSIPSVSKGKAGRPSRQTFSSHTLARSTF